MIQVPVQAAGARVAVSTPATGSQTGATRRGTSRLDRAAGRGCLVALLAAFGWAFLDGVQRYPALSDDEGTYVAQAWAVLQHGELAHYTYWYDHPPLGWIQLAGLTGLLGWAAPGASAVVQARYLMFIPALVSVALVYVIARRMDQSRWMGLLAVALFGFSPLGLPLLRQVYLDNVALPWVLSAVALALDRRGRLWSAAGAGACLAVAVLSKETMLLLLPAVMFAAWQHSNPQTRSFVLTALGTSFVLIVAFYPLLAVLKGELLPGPGHVSLLEAIRFQLSGRSSTGSGLQPGTGSYGLVSGWIGADPALVAGGCLLAPIALLSRALRPAAVAVLLLVTAAARPGYLPAPLVIAALPLCALLLTGGAGRILAAARTLSPPALRPGAVALAALAILGASAGVGWWRAAPISYVVHTDATDSALAAKQWIVHNVDPRARILVDDSFFVDLADVGFDPGLGVVWFYKLDFSANLDPSVVRALPNGHRSFDYVVSTRIIRSAVQENLGRFQEVRAALDASTPVATFGTGADVVEVRRLVAPDTASGRIPPPVPAQARP